MKRVEWYLILLLVSIPLLVGGACGTSELPSPPTPYSSVSIPIEEFPNHPHIDVVMHAVVGEELTVTLGSNPTTGFQWSETPENSDQTVLQQIAHEFIPPEDLAERPPPAGSPGKEVWTFKTLKKGISTISFEYSRPSEGGEKGEWTFDLEVHVRERSEGKGHPGP